MYTDFAFLDLGTPELLLILTIALLLFGGKKLPELSKSIGRSLKYLRSGMADDGPHYEADSNRPKKTT